MKKTVIRLLPQIGIRWALLLVIGGLGAASCARVQISHTYNGQVVDAATGAPLPRTAILVRVMRVSSYDGTSQFRRYTYATNEKGEFLLPARKKMVDSIVERAEDVHYYEVIDFAKDGYQKQEVRTDEEDNALDWAHAVNHQVVIRLRKLDSAPSR